jgi:hypothetical protein
MVSYFGLTVGRYLVLLTVRVPSLVGASLPDAQGLYRNESQQLTDLCGSSAARSDRRWSRSWSWSWLRLEIEIELCLVEIGRFVLQPSVFCGADVTVQAGEPEEEGGWRVTTLLEDTESGHGRVEICG